MDGFREIYERHRPAVYRLALFLTGDPARAEDLTADTFVRAWTARERIRYQTVLGYLLTITRNLYRDQLRARRTFVEIDDQVADTQPGVDARIEHARDVEDAWARLRQAAPGDRRALLLYVVKEMSYAEIATALGVSISAVKSRISRAREAMRAGHVAHNGESS
jgi:RNA polymerase sigma-70 factor (ECF subfamily)